jgi:phage host-nuclease inhibitor protein Gam
MSSPPLKPARSKRPAAGVPVPTSMAGANVLLVRVGAIQRDLAVIRTALDEAVAHAKSQAETEAAPLAAEMEALTAGLQIWAEANRQALTDQGRSKTVQLPAGEIAWRQRPPSVRLRDTAGVLAAIAQLGLERFIRRREEVDKDAMLREPAVAATIPGVSIGSAGEDFIVSPVGVTLEAGGAP